MHNRHFSTWLIELILSLLKSLPRKFGDPKAANIPQVMTTSHNSYYIRVMSYDYNAVESFTSQYTVIKPKGIFTPSGRDFFFHFCIKSAIVIHKRYPTTTFTTCTSWVPIQAYSMVNYKFATWLTAYFNVGSLKWLFQCFMIDPVLRQNTSVPFQFSFFRSIFISDKQGSRWVTTSSSYSVYCYSWSSSSTGFACRVENTTLDEAKEQGGQLVDDPT